MTDAVAVLAPGWRALDSNADVVPGAILYFYSAGTSTPATVYSDAGLLTALGTSVTCDSAGYPTSDGNTKTLIYTGTSSYKITLKDSDGNTIWSHDNVRGADVIPTSSSTGLPTTPVVSKTNTYSVVAGDQGKLINANPTGGSFAITLPSAVTVGDSWRIGVRHAAANSNVVTARTTGGQTIGLPGQTSATSVSLTGLGHTMWFVSDGAGWHVDTVAQPLMQGSFGIVKVTDRLTAPPASPAGGARYICNGTATGAWATLSVAEHDIVESDGNGSWLIYAPVDGWLAYVIDENTYTSFQDSAWVDLDNVVAPAVSYRKRAQYSYTLAQGTNGAAPTASAWTTYPLNTEDADTIGASIASNTITLPTGTYDVDARVQVYGAWPLRLRLHNTTTTTYSYGEVSYSPGFATSPTVLTGQMATLSVRVTVSAATETFKLEYYASSVNGSAVFGVALNLSGITERYGVVTITDAATSQGPTGAAGPQGAAGAGYAGASTTSLAIGTGAKTFTMDATGYAYVVGSRVRAVSDASPTVNWMEGYVTSYSGTTLELTVDLIGGSGTLADWSFSIAGTVPDALINDLDGGGYSITNVLSDNGSITGSGNLTAAMSGTVQIVNSGSNVTLTMPNSLEVGWTCTFVQIGTGQAIFAAASGATINNRQGDDRTHSQWAMAVLTVVSNSGGSAAVAVLGGDTA